MVDSCETESTAGDGEGSHIFVIFFLYVLRSEYSSLGEEEQGGGDSSKSNSITSEQSIQSTGISASSQSSSTSSIPPRTVDPDNSSIYPMSVRNRTKVCYIVTEFFFLSFLVSGLVLFVCFSFCFLFFFAFDLKYFRYFT